MVAVPKGEITFAQYASLAGRTDMGASLRDLVLGAQKQIGSLAGSLQEQQLGMMPEPSRAARDIGSTYWYLALLTKRLGLDLGEILKQNLAYNLDRWGNGVPFVYDMGLPALQSLPGRGRWYFLQYEEADHLYVQVTVKDEFGDDHLVGDRLTDNTVRKDGYRFHDVHHLSHAVYLSWSPTLRSVLHRKRKVHWELDNNEDGARATQAEEHITNLIHREADQNREFADVQHVSTTCLRQIREYLGAWEVGNQSLFHFEQCILSGYEIWRKLMKNNGGIVTFDRFDRTRLKMEYEPLGRPFKQKKTPRTNRLQLVPKQLGLRLKTH